MYLDGSGKPIPGATLQGGKAAAIPGVPAGMVHLAQRYGRLPLAQSLAPAIALARDGFKVDPRYARIAKLRERFLVNGVNTARIFLADNRAPQPGYLLRQPQLAATLELVAQHGRDGFYRGRIAQALVAAANAAGGVWSLSDLENYQAVERAPVKFSYRGATIVTAALPSAGGVTLAQALNILEQFTLGDARDPASAHFVIEALRRGFPGPRAVSGRQRFRASAGREIDSQVLRAQPCRNHRSGSGNAERRARHCRRGDDRKRQHHALLGDRRRGQPRRRDVEHQFPVRCRHRGRRYRRAAQQ